MQPVQVEVIAYAPTAFFHCQHCEITFHQLGIGTRMRHIDAEESLPPELLRDYLDLSDWIHELRERYGHRIAVRMIDAASLVGVWTSFRHSVRSYPAVRVDSGRWIKEDYRSLDPLIDQLVADTGRNGSPRSPS